ncbi:MAG: lasso peptide biosynthesis B2 protein [Actinomycetota bacterium]|nr:lasso peptide biosynthesis B2 protein [Actinomycetota bacterium]
MSIAADLRGLAALRPADVALSAEALRELVRARKERHGHELQRALAERRPPERRADGADPLRVARGVRRAGRLLPGGDNCLVQSIALERMLRRRGHPAELRIGVRRAPEGLAAHAWVEHGGRALLEGGLQRFARLEEAAAPRMRFGGEVIETRLELPGAQPAPGAKPTLRLELDAEVRGPGWELRAEAARADGPPLWQLCERGGAYLLSLAGSCEIELDLGSERVLLRSAPGAALEQAIQDFLGSGLALLGALRGRVVLHASAVALEKAAVGFVGRSGAGKSTLAGWLAGRGDALVAEDLLVLEPRDGGFVALPGASALKLDPAGPLAVADHHPVPKSPRKGWARATGASEALPLRALFLLERDGGGLELEAVRGGAVVAALLPHVTVAGLMRPEVLGGALQAGQTELVTRLAGSVPVARLRYRSGADSLEHVARALEEHGGLPVSGA